jgi:hypothetical protein
MAASRPVKSQSREAASILAGMAHHQPGPPHRFASGGWIVLPS